MLLLISIQSRFFIKSLQSIFSPSFKQKPNICRQILSKVTQIKVKQHQKIPLSTEQ